MRMRSVFCWVAFCLLIAGQSQAVLAASEMKIGILATRDKAAVQKQWEPIGELLSRKIGVAFSIKALEYGQVDAVIKSGQVDFLLANPAIQALMEEKYGLKALLTMVNRKQHLPMKEFGGVIFTRSDSDIRELKDLKSKRLTCVNFTSFGGAISGWRLLIESGIDPRRDCASFHQTGGGQDNVVMAVQAGKADAGMVRTGILEGMHEDNLIRIEDFRVLRLIGDDFPYLHSTQLYPEWAFSRCAATDAVLAKNVAKVLMLLNPDDPAMVASKVYRWTYPANYEGVLECLHIVGLQ